MKSRTPAKFLLLLATAALLAGCGTISKMENVGDESFFDASKYSRAVVLDFSNSAPTKRANNAKIAEHNEKVEIAGRYFADRIAAELRKRHLFAEVKRNEKKIAEELSKTMAERQPSPALGT